MNTRGSADRVIRPACEVDTADLHALHTAAVRSACAPHYSTAVIEGWLHGRAPADYLPPVQRGDLHVAERGGEVLGFVEAVPGSVVALYVAPSAMRQGVGAALFQHGLSTALAAAGGDVVLQATLNAVGFYRRFGFDAVRHTHVVRNRVEVPIVEMLYRRP
ncbi:MAG: GNAT family N-acetyltransferase [Pseudomonadota bacterium]